jgi:hypothetical protein
VAARRAGAADEGMRRIGVMISNAESDPEGQAAVALRQALDRTGVGWRVASRRAQICAKYLFVEARPGSGKAAGPVRQERS